MSSLLTDLSVKCEMQAMDILALRKQLVGLEYENDRLKILARGMAKELAIDFAEKTGDMPDGSWYWYEHMEDLGIDTEDLGIGADMRWKLVEGVSSDDVLIGLGESGTEADDD